VPYEEYQSEVESEEPVFDEVSVKEAKARIAACIRRLNDNYSEILYLKAAMGYSNEEIAQILGISKENVKVRLYRARMALKAELEKGDVSDE
jgi:RNA polymerase sigma-70 factor (ECF subfamily)